MLTVTLAYYIYKYTCKPNSCIRYRLNKLSRFLLRNKDQTPLPSKASIEAADDVEEEPFVEPPSSRALVLRNRYELQPLSRRSARELQTLANRRNAPLPPAYRAPIPLENIP